MGAWASAHSHVDGKRFWNVKHPTAYNQKLCEGHCRCKAILTPAQVEDELIMLGIRMREGLNSIAALIELLTNYRENGYVAA